MFIFQTPNAELEYLIIGNSDSTRFFGVAADGSIFIKRPLTNANVDGVYTRRVSCTKHLPPGRLHGPRGSILE